MHRRLVALGAVTLALAIAGSAAAVTVHVRVEGASRTIFGTAQPLLTPFTGELVADDGSSVELDVPTALGALEAASARGEFFYRLTGTSFGPYVSQIGRRSPEGSSGWVYKVNGVSPPVGADSYVVKEGDEVLWYFATFGPTGGPQTLDLVSAGRGCYRAFEVDDTGARTPARDVVFRLRSHGVRDGDGVLCPRGHWHKLKVTKPGAIRSETVLR